MIFDPQKESDQQTSVQVEGGMTSFTQTGLAAGQDYTVSVTGETGGRKGAESAAQFTTRERVYFCFLFLPMSFQK